MLTWLLARSVHVIVVIGDLSLDGLGLGGVFLRTKRLTRSSERQDDFLLLKDVGSVVVRAALFGMVTVLQ